MNLRLLDCYAKYIMENPYSEYFLFRLFYFAAHFVIPSNHQVKLFVSHALVAPLVDDSFLKIPTIFQKVTYIKNFNDLVSIRG